MISWMEEGGRIPDFVKDISDQFGGEGGALLIGGPSFVRTPPELGPELGSRKMDISKQGWVDMRCPVCQAAAPVYVFRLEENVHVSCCSTCKQYGWFRPKEDDNG